MLYGIGGIIFLAVIALVFFNKTGYVSTATYNKWLNSTDQNAIDFNTAIGECIAIQRFSNNKGHLLSQEILKHLASKDVLIMYLYSVEFNRMQDMFNIVTDGALKNKAYQAQKMNFHSYLLQFK